MKRSDLAFDRPPELEARTTPEDRGIPRDGVRLLVSAPEAHEHARFRELPEFLRERDLLVVNDSATIPASLPASTRHGRILVNLCTPYGNDLWLVEPRWGPDRPGPLPVVPGEPVHVGVVEGRFLAPFPGLPRLWFVRFLGDLKTTISRLGHPIRYGYLQREYPLSVYQTLFGEVSGSAEMPSAARPFTPAVLADLQARGVDLATLTLHTGVSSLEVEASLVEAQVLYPEPFEVPLRTARRINAALAHGRRVIAVGTTVVRALETAWDGTQVRATRGFTQAYIHPGRSVHVVSGLLTGFHDPTTTHLALLYALFPPDRVRTAYEEAVDHGYRWHEFGDSHLLLT